MSNLLQPMQGVKITVAASDKLATYSTSPYSVQSRAGYPNVPPTTSQVFLNSGNNLTAAQTKATDFIIQAGNAPLWYETGTTPVITERANVQASYQATPGALNATGTLTALLLQGGVVTSSTAAAVTATLDTGAAMDIAIDQDADTGFFWSAINTGGANAFTVTAAASGHTLVGSGAVAASTSGRFLTRRTATDTWITYRLA